MDLAWKAAWFYKSSAKAGGRRQQSKGFSNLLARNNPTGNLVIFAIIAGVFLS